MAMADGERLMSRAEVGLMLRVPPSTLANWAALSRGPRYYRVGRHARYRMADVTRWLEGNARVPEHGRAAR